MGSKNNPGKFDCYYHALPDEPMFVLLGRDPMAPVLVRLWARLRKARGEDQAKVDEAMACADKMSEWLRRLEKPEIAAVEVAERLEDWRSEEIRYEDREFLLTRLYPLEAKVMAQFKRFELELPELLKTNPGDWVVFLDGPQWFERSEREALDWACRTFGAEAGFVVAQVSPQEPVLPSAAMAFRPEKSK